MKRMPMALMIAVAIIFSYETGGEARSSALASPIESKTPAPLGTQIVKMSDDSYAAILDGTVFVSDDPLTTWRLAGRLPVKDHLLLVGGSKTRFFVTAADENQPRKDKNALPALRLFSIEPENKDQSVKELPPIEADAFAFASESTGALYKNDFVKITTDGGQTWTAAQTVFAKGSAGAIMWLGTDTLIVGGGRPSQITRLRIDSKGAIRVAWSINPDDTAMLGFSRSGNGSIWPDSINGVGSWNVDTGKSDQVIESDTAYDHVFVNGDYVFLLGTDLSIWGLNGHSKELHRFRKISPTALLPLKQKFLIATQSGRYFLWSPEKDILEDASIRLEGTTTEVRD